MSRILHVITGLEIGGAESMLVKLVIGSDSVRFSHEVVCLRGDGPNRQVLEGGGIRVHSGFWSLPRAARRFQPDWIQGWMVHGNLAALLARRFARQSRVAWNCRHTLDDLSNEKTFTRAAIRLSARCAGRPDIVIHNSVAGAKDHRSIGFPSRTSMVIPNGFDTERFRPSWDARMRLRRDLAIPDEAVVIGNIARCHPMKDQGRLLEALRELPSDCWVIIAGHGVDESEALEHLLDELAIRDRVRLMGRTAHTERLYPALDIFCLCSRAVEGFPNVIGEAMSCGVPCVVTDVGDSRRIVGDTGLAVPASDTPALVRALQEMKIRVREDASQLQRNCRSRVQAEFSLASVVTQYEDLYASARIASAPTARRYKPRGPKAL